MYSALVKMFGKGSKVLLLPELLKDWPCTVTGKDFRVSITGITENSRDVKYGDIFVARKGHKVDGSLYIIEAIRNGAAAIVIDKPIDYHIPLSIPVVTVSDCRRFISFASAVLSGSPSDSLTVIAVTGTNGKTTVSYFIGQILNRLGVRCAVIGTTGIFIDGVRIDYRAPQMTTLPAEFLHPLLRKCVDEGVTHVVLEASSLGLSMYRLEHCSIDIGILLNVGSDHYDEHGGKQAYIEAKKKLVKMAKQLVVNGDDDICVEMVTSASKPCLYFGMKTNSDIFLRIQDLSMFVKNRDEEGELRLLVLGEFNRLNTLAAIGALRCLSYHLVDILPHTASLELPEGRMQCVERGGVSVVIDYAHTPDALEAVLCTLLRTYEGRLITVFGCGGERDKGKRGEMGELAVLYSSSVIVTSDNPRNEDPLVIIADIMMGFGNECKAVNVEPDRKHAIQQAISLASAGDVVLIAGKGHEKTQHTADGILAFSDLAVAEQALIEKFQQEKRT